MYLLLRGLSTIYTEHMEQLVLVCLEMFDISGDAKFLTRREIFGS